MLNLIKDICEAWSFTLREEHGLSCFGNRMLNKISGSKEIGDNCVMICTAQKVTEAIK